ncbi:MAG TPA: protein kinase [Trebonia sp.]
MALDHGMSEPGSDDAGSGPSDRLIGGRYRLVAAIGQGSMGRVWQGRDELLDRDVALKEILFPPDLSAAERDELQQRQLREARSAARLSHPAVATVFDVIDELGRPWIVMEFVRGRSLDRVLRERGPLPPEFVTRIGRDVLAALSAAHAAGILHRDVKPSNVLLTGGGAVLTDFGVAAIDGDPSLTRGGMVMGTPAYSAPERIHGRPAAAAADLWSLGLTLYAAAEGQGAYDNCGSITSTIAAIATQDPAPPRNAGPNTTVIMALLSRDPAARPTAEAAMRMLAEAAAALQAGATVPRPAAGATAPPAQALSSSLDQAGALGGRPEVPGEPSAAQAGPQAGNSGDSGNPWVPDHLRRLRRLVVTAVAGLVVVLGVSLWAVHQSDNQGTIVQALQTVPGIQGPSPTATDSTAPGQLATPVKTARSGGSVPTQSAAAQAGPSRPAATSAPVTQQPTPPQQPSSGPGSHPTDPASTPAPPGCGTLLAGQSLKAGDSLTSCNGEYKLGMQSDGNLVLYNGSGAVWNSGTDDAVAADMQGDGNFVLYNSAGTGVWDTGTNPNGAYLVVDNSGYLAVDSASGSVLWKSTVNG